MYPIFGPLSISMSGKLGMSSVSNNRHPFTNKPLFWKWQFLFSPYHLFFVITKKRLMCCNVLVLDGFMSFIIFFRGISHWSFFFNLKKSITYIHIQLLPTLLNVGLLKWLSSLHIYQFFHHQRIPLG